MTHRYPIQTHDSTHIFIFFMLTPALRRYIYLINEDANKGPQQMKAIKIKAATAAEASALYIAKREASGLGASRFPCGDWDGHHISYNGRVWEKKPLGEAKSIYNPGGRTPDIWKASTL